MRTALVGDVPLVAHGKAVRALDDFDALVTEYEMLLDTQQALVRSANFGALFEMASRGDRLARDAAMCGRRFTPLVDAVTSGQFVGPRAAEIRRRSFASNSRAQTLGSATARLVGVCAAERDVMGRDLRRSNAAGSDAGLPPAYQYAGRQHVLDRSA